MVRLLSVLTMAALASACQSPRPPAPKPVTTVVDTDRIVPDGARIMVAAGHGGDITGIAPTPDGRLIATIATDHIARVFMSDGLREVAQFIEPSSKPRRVALSADGAR